MAEKPAYPDCKPGSEEPAPAPTMPAPVQPEKGQQSPYKLSYVDFWPNKLTDGAGSMSMPTFEQFGTCVQRANLWLQQNLNIEVILCESAELRIEYGGVVNPESTIFCSRDVMRRTYFLRGLRLWSVPRLTPGPPIQISYVNTVPRMLRKGGYIREAEFEKLPQVLDALNKMFKENPLPGKILNVETQDMKVGEKFSGDMAISPDQSVFSDGGRGGVFHLFVLRVFYVCGPPAYEEIGMADFMPRCLTAGGMMKMPTFEGFSSPVTQAAQWIQQNQQTLRITNLQSIDIKMNMRGFGASDVAIDNQSMSFYENGKVSTLYLRSVRICYTKPFNGAPPSPSPPISLGVKVFYPIQLSNIGTFKQPTFETFSQTMQRASAWLQVVGRRVIAVETVSLYMNIYENMAAYGGGSGAECSVMVGGGKHVMSYQFVIRVYLDGPFQEPPAEMLPALPPNLQNVKHWTTKNKQSCCLV